MKELPESLLIECLDLLEDGMPITQILARYPEQAETLRPYLETAVAVSQFAPRPTLHQKQTSQAAFLEQAAAMKTANTKQSSRPLWLRLVTPLAGLTLLLFLFGFFVVNASSTTIPGDALYNVKRWVEDVRIQTASSPDTRLDLIAGFKEERIREVAALIRSGRSADVEFDGLIEEFNEKRWLISGIQTEITEQTIIEGTPAVDSLARVKGYVANGRLEASLILVLTGNPEPEPTSTPLPEATNTPIATATENVTETSTAVATQTATPTSTPSPSATNTPTAVTATAEPTNTPTSEPTPEPTATSLPPMPTPDDNGNENEDDNENENDNDNEGGNENEDSNDNDDSNNNDDDSSGSGNGNDNDTDDDNDNNDNDDDSSGSGNGNDNDTDDDNDNNDNDDDHDSNDKD